MFRFTPVLVLLAACGSLTEAPEEDNKLELEVEMAEATLMIPASEAEMLREEILSLKAETVRLQAELVESNEPKPRQIARHAQASSRLVAATSELNRLKEELAEARTQLAASEERNQELTIELAKTAEELDRTEDDLKQTEVVLGRTKEDLSDALRLAADAGWSDLVARTQVALCPKGSRNKMTNCRADAKAAIAPLEEVSRACIYSGQAVPELRGTEKSANVPNHSVYVGKSDRDWYVTLCDPSLPEARELLASRSQKPRATQEKVASISSSSTRKVANTSSRTAPRKTSEPVDLLDDSSGGRDADLDLDETVKETREQRKARKEREATGTVRKDLNLGGVGDDLDDEF